MKHDVGDALYDSSSSVSSDSGAGSHSSSRLSSHDFLSSIAAGTTNNTTPPNNLVSLDGLHSGVPTRTTPTLTPTTLRSIEQTFLELTSESGSHSREAGFVPPLVEPSQPTPAQTHNTAGHHNSNNNHHHNNNNNNSSHNLTNTNNSSSNSETGSNNSNSNSNTNICQGINNGVNGNSNNSNGDNNQQQQQEEQLAGLGIGLGLGLGLGHGIGGIGQPQQQQQQTRRNMGGRRPNRTIGMSPEEEERRQVRRERNKMAAARCRKRRMDHTNALMEETDGLEQKKQSLQDEIQQLQQAKDELEFILEAHRAVCRLRASSPQDIKPVIKTNDIQQQQQQQQQQHHHQQQQQQQQHHVENEFAEPLLKRASIASGKPNRPNSLAVGFDNNNRPNSLAIFTEPKERPDTLQFKTVETPAFMKTVQEVAGIPITTPSSGIPFNFESLMEGGTGLTPVSTPLIPSCSSQQRNNLSAVDLSSPDANPPKLVSL